MRMNEIRARLLTAILTVGRRRVQAGRRAGTELAPQIKLRDSRGRIRARLCRWCRGEVQGRRRTFCGDRCVREYMAASGSPRSLCRARDRGVCQACGLDTRALERALWRRARRNRGHGAREKLFRQLQRAAGFDHDRSWWDADHIVPLADGGASTAENLRTLCRPCHRRVTAEWRRDRAARRRGQAALAFALLLCCGVVVAAPSGGMEGPQEPNWIGAGPDSGGDGTPEIRWTMPAADPDGTAYTDLAWWTCPTLRPPTGCDEPCDDGTGRARCAAVDELCGPAVPRVGAPGAWRRCAITPARRDRLYRVRWCSANGCAVPYSEEPHLTCTPGQGTGCPGELWPQENR